MTTNDLGFGERYTQAVGTTLDVVRHDEEPCIRRAAELVASSVAQGGVMHVFGAGHSQLVAADATFRAGGAAWANGILDSALSIARGAIASTRTEKIEAVADPIFEQLDPNPIDVTVVVANSGYTPITRRWAELASKRGMRVIGVVSGESMAFFRERGAPSIDNWCDVVLDNHAPIGDVTVRLADDLAFGPISTIINCFLVQWLVVATHEALVAQGKEVDAFRSGHMPGASDHNAALIDRYGEKIDIL